MGYSTTHRTEHRKCDTGTVWSRTTGTIIDTVIHVTTAFNVSLGRTITYMAHSKATRAVEDHMQAPQ